MATIATAQTGFFDLTTTWVGGVVPVAGDAIDRQGTHVLTIRTETPWLGVDIDGSTSGPETANGQWSVLAPESGGDAGGGLVIADGGNLRVTGGIQTGQGSGVFPGTNGEFTGQAGGKIEFDCDYDQMFRISHGAYEFLTVTITGSVDNWFEFENIGSGDVSVRGAGAGTASILASYTRFKNIAGVDFIVRVQFDHVIFDENCGGMASIQIDGSALFRFRYVTFLNTSSSVVLSGSGSSIDGDSFKSVVWFGYLQLYFGDAMGGTFDGMYNIGGTNSFFSGVVGVFKNGFYLDDSPTATFEQFKDNFFMREGDNPHFLGLDADEAISDGNIFKQIGDYTTDVGDCNLAGSPSVASTQIIRNCIELPNDAGRSSGVMLTLFGNANLTVDVHNNTFVTFMRVGETYIGHAGMVSDFVNNICYDPGSGPQKLISFQSASVPIDVIVNADHNSAYDTTDPYELVSYSDRYQASPGTNDENTDPDFLDQTRNEVTFAVDVLGSTGSTLAQHRAFLYAAFAAKNDPENVAYDELATVENLVSYIRDGFNPQNGAYVDGGASGSFPDYIGATQPFTNVTSVESLLSDISADVPSVDILLGLSIGAYLPAMTANMPSISVVESGLKKIGCLEGYSMPKLPQYSTDNSVDVLIVDADKNPITGLVFNSAGASCYYKTGAAAVEVPLVTLASVSAPHEDGGFIEVDAVNMPGMYRLDLPDSVTLSDLTQSKFVISFDSSALMVYAIDLDHNPKAVTGAVTVGTSTTVFSTDVSAPADAFNASFLLFRTGTLAGQTRQITDFVQSGGVFTTDAFTSAPSADDSFVIVNR